jgi:polyisoprenoid-binding protein YceI
LATDPGKEQENMTTTTDLTQLTGDYTLDVAHSRFGFVARHAMVTKVRGAFNEFEGTARIDGDDPAQSAVNIVIKTASVDTRNAQRDGHLRTNDFFEIETYPEIVFASTAIDRKDETTFEVTGDLRIKDVTRPITFDLEFTGAATDPFGNQRVGFDGSVVINRKDWNVTWNAPLEAGGVLVSEKVTLEFEISAIKQA